MKSISDSPYGGEHIILTCQIDNTVYNTPEYEEPEKDRFNVGVWRIKKIT